MRKTRAATTATPKTPGSANMRQPDHRPAPTAEEIRKLAYKKWEDAGHPEGADVWFWLDAEQELHRDRTP